MGRHKRPQVDPIPITKRPRIDFNTDPTSTPNTDPDHGSRIDPRSTPQRPLVNPQIDPERTCIDPESIPRSTTHRPPEARR